MGHTVRSKIIPHLIGEVVKEYESGNILIVKLGTDRYILGHKDHWEVV